MEEVGRLLLCCLLKHQDLGNLATASDTHVKLALYVLLIMFFLFLFNLMIVPVCAKGHVALSLVNQCALAVDQGKQRSLPKSVIDVCRMVYQAKCSLIKVRFYFIIKIIR